jgi:8-oxo-dGTP pyrophosphatase MutT (NUDIX family)
VSPENPTPAAPTDLNAIEAKPAATVMLVRDDEIGVEVFVLRRTASAAFAAGMYVFPGGKVDDIDGAEAIEPYCEGLDDAQASALLGIERGGLAFWVAAVRECFEEAGVLLARKRDGSPPDPDDDDRRAVHAGTLSMEDLCIKHDLVLDLSTIRYVAHWVTPVGEGARRFDTRFFLASAPEEQEGLHDDSETVHSMWVRPEAAIAQAEAGELLMMPPTIANLRFVGAYRTAEDALAAADAAGPPPRIQPKVRKDAEGRIVGVAMPGDGDYDDLA